MLPGGVGGVVEPSGIEVGGIEVGGTGSMVVSIVDR